MKTIRLQDGFTLIELIVAVLIVSILAAVAYPSYRDYVVRGKRAEGKTALLKAAQLQERNYLNGDPNDANPNRAPTYVNTAGLARLFGLTATDTIYSGETPGANTGWYTIVVDAPAAGTGCTTTLQDCFQLRAVPNNAAPRNFSDTGCDQMTLDSAGRRGENGTLTVNECWDK